MPTPEQIAEALVLLREVLAHTDRDCIAHNKIAKAVALLDEDLSKPK